MSIYAVIYLGEGLLEKASSVQNIPKYQWFLKEKKKGHPEHYPYLIRSNHYLIIHINSVSYNSLTLIGTSSFFPFVLKERRSVLYYLKGKKVYLLMKLYKNIHI